MDNNITNTNNKLIELCSFEREEGTQHEQEDTYYEEYMSDFLDSRRESLADSSSNMTNDSLVMDSIENSHKAPLLPPTVVPSLQLPQALHSRPAPIVASTGGVDENFNSNNVVINNNSGIRHSGNGGADILKNMKAYVFPPTSNQTQPRQRRNTTVNSTSSHNYNAISTATPSHNSTHSSITLKNNNSFSSKDSDHLPPQKDQIDAPRKTSIYTPVHHANIGQTTTSILHIFRFATLFDYVLIMFATFFSFCNGAITPLMTQLLGDLFNIFTEQSTGIITRRTFEKKINEAVLKFILLGIATFILSALMTSMWMWTGERQTRRMREIYFQSLLRMDLGYFEREEITSGGLLTGLNKDTDDIQNAISENLGLAIQYLTTFMGCMVLAFYKNYLLTLVIITAVPFLLFSLNYTSRKAAPLIKEEREIFLKAGNILEYSLSAIKTVKSFNGEEKEEKRHFECLKEANTVSANLAWIFALRTGIMQFLLLSLFVQGFWYGANLVANKKLTPGDVLSVFYACLLGASALKSTLPLLNFMARAKNAVHKINELLTKVAILDIEALRGFKMPKCEGNIKFEQVSFAYPSRPDTYVLQNVNINIPAGQTTVIIGQSGSGKSTIAQLIQKLYEVKDGVVKLDNREIRILNTQWLRQQIGVVSQEPILFDGTIFQNVAYGKPDFMKVTLEQVIEACKIACIHDDIEKLADGYHTKLGDKGQSLSGGQRQRIAIARALIKDPAILILDEASSALDLTSDREVQKALDNCRHGRTTLVITHHLTHIKDTDLLYILDKGVLVESGLKKDLIKNEEGHFYKIAQKAEILHSKRASFDLHFDGSRSSIPSPKLQYEECDLSTSAGLLKRSLSMATRVGWRQSVIEDYIDVKALELLNQSASASINKRNDNRLSYFGVLSYYDNSEDSEKPIDIMISNQINLVPEDKIKMSIWQLFQSTMENKLLYTVGLFAAIVNGFVMPIFSYVMSKLLTTYTLTDKNQLQSQARNWAIVVLVLAIGNGISAHYKYFLLERASEQWAVRLRHLGFCRILRQSQSFFDKSDSASGKLTTILISDTDTAKNLVGHFMGSMVFVIISLFAGLVWGFITGWELSLVGFGLVPIILLITEFQRRILQKFESERKKSIEEASNAFYQRIRLEEYKMALQVPYDIGVKKALVVGSFSGLLEAVGYFTKALTFWYGAHLIVQGTYDLKTMLTVWTLVIFCTTSAGTILTTIPYYEKSKQAGKSLCQIMSLPKPQTGGKKLDKVYGSISFKNIYFTYPERPNNLILKGLDFSITAGKTIALVGKSGNGKSTIAALLQRFYAPTSGTIMFDYENLHEFDLHWLRGQIGTVSQEPVLFDMTIAENIKYGKDSATQTEIELVAKRVNLHNFIMELSQGYNTPLGSNGSKLSGGQKQRIAIARVLLRDPKILILDEATSALDKDNELEVLRVLDQAKQGRTTLMITHRLDTARLYADKIAYMDQGKIAELGTHDELMELRGGYWSLVTENNVKSRKKKEV
ncbi:5379_t:CDS:2 [Ambispora gerdemannii]|uniref:5379_t:CDS:1 n=1 Tax=Ambispora gerdemannii TaxID=144530 RepID=A0A9N9AB34_9GLOM|nr:5379_t:CDS:2 [Ambispora gerdemannii]